MALPQRMKMTVRLEGGFMAELDFIMFDISFDGLDITKFNFDKKEIQQGQMTITGRAESILKPMTLIEAYFQWIYDFKILKNILIRKIKRIICQKMKP